MPQIFPMNWFILSLIMMMMMFLATVYFYFLNFKNKNKMKYMKKMFYKFNYKF
uniref:ATP synthase subunit 8 n=1 Tax=Rhipicephalus microplus TaxID=6941 RepID=V9MM95_RHIMP|nr:ATP synthase subunit 8 [Rhipicephalus microplus]UNO54407.1 ATP synthase F0 subunit 8 [Rhipicephalus microplus]WJR82416.1 ATP synthase F0 subunit 8 [Rhipicephalus microplus]